MDTFTAGMIEQLRQQRNSALDLLANANGRILQLAEALGRAEKELQELRTRHEPV